MDCSAKAALVVLLGLAVLGLVWLGHTSYQRAMRKAEAACTEDGKHHADQDDAVTVSDLLERAVREGDPLRLAWPEVNLDEAGLVRPYRQYQFPTGVLPKVDDSALQPPGFLLKEAR